MESKYISFKNHEEAVAFLDDKLYMPKEWYKSSELTIYGYFEYAGLVVFGTTITTTQAEAIQKVGIFRDMKCYGSSKKYKGLKNVHGVTILENNYEEISLFCKYNFTVYLLVRRNGKLGLLSHRLRSDNTDEIFKILPVEYDEIFEAGEYTFGIIKNGKVGFISLDGKFIIEPMYKINPDDRNINPLNHFFEGQALVCVDHPHGYEHFINHYGNIVGLPDYDDTPTFGQGTGYYPHEDFPDSLDAYEGEESNRWNTD